MDKNNIDVGFVSDIRQTAVECEHLKRKIKGMFKDDVHCSTSEVVDPGTTNGKVGGQLVIVRQLWKNCVTNVWTDRAKLGGLMILYLKTANQKTLAIGNTYWPTKPGSVKAVDNDLPPAAVNNSLWNKYTKWLSNLKERQDPITYLRECTETRFDKHMQKGHPAILMGDFNAHWDGRGASYNDLAEWAADCCWQNEIEERSTTSLITLDTFIRGTPSQIDHILTGGSYGTNRSLDLTGFGCATGAVWQLFKDHVPLWAAFKIPSGGVPPLQREKGISKKGSPSSTPNIFKEEDIAEYEKRMENLLLSLPSDNLESISGSQLEDICRGSVLAAKKVKPNMKKNKYSCNGWSPIYVALRAQLICMINIRRGLCGYKHVYWPAEDRQRNIASLIHRWRDVVDRFTFECDADKLKIMSWTGKDPSFWIENADDDPSPLADMLSDEISYLHQAISGRKRSEFRKLISYYCRLREKNFREGKIGPAIRAVSGKVMNTYDMQSLRIDEDTTLADEDEIHMAMVEFFEKWHKGADYLRTGIHDPDNNWLEIYENHDTFINMTADCNAPLELRELIWQAMQSTRVQMDETEKGVTLRQRMS